MTLEILQQRLKDFTDHLKTQVHPLKNLSQSHGQFQSQSKPDQRDSPLFQPNPLILLKQRECEITMEKLLSILVSGKLLQELILPALWTNSDRQQ